MQSDLDSNFHVLIVERDDLIRELFPVLLVRLGYTVDTTARPTEALEIVKKKVPDVILSSLVFQGMDGFELCRQLRAISELADKTIVAITGYSAKGVREEATNAGFDEFLLKPVDIEVLLSLLGSVKFKRDTARLASRISP